MRLWTLLLLLGLLFLISCTQESWNTYFGEVALAGQAISKSCYDADNDGYGRSGRAISSCPGSSKLFDCNDNMATINPGTSEICGNRVDDNCNKRIDERGCVLSITVPTRVTCLPTPEVCDGVDNNCDALVDEAGCVATCTDSDGGPEVEIGGVTIGGNNTFIDYCGSRASNGQATVRESYCDGGRARQSSYYCFGDQECIDPDGSGPTPAYCGSATPTSTCGNGILEPGEICDDGNAIYGDGCTSSCSLQTCTDTDGYNRENLSVRGTVQGYWAGPTSGNPLVTEVDTCEDSTHLREYLCNAGADNILATEVACPSGQVCAEGACINAESVGLPVLPCGAIIREGTSFRLAGHNYRYLSADRVTQTAPIAQFRDLDTYETLESPIYRNVSAATIFLIRDGEQYRFENTSTADVDDFDLKYICDQSPVCGNGILESGEICDDGNTLDNDGCNQCLCADSDATNFSASPDASYQVAGTVRTSADEWADRCSPEWTDLFENFCDGAVRREVDFSCEALGPVYSCMIDNSRGWGVAYCGR